MALVGITLIQGAEDLLADRAIADVVAANKEATVTQLDAETLELGGITDALAPSLFGDARIIVIRAIQDLAADLADEITEYLANPDTGVELVLWHKGGVKGKALLEKIKKLKPTLIEVEAIKKESDKSEFVRSEFSRLGRKISRRLLTPLEVICVSSLLHVPSWHLMCRLGQQLVLKMSRNSNKDVLKQRDMTLQMQRWMERQIKP